jgi:hypothetical protein
VSALDRVGKVVVEFYGGSLTQRQARPFSWSVELPGGHCAELPSMVLNMGSVRKWRKKMISM